jgi:ATP-dependent DNA helicase RecG
LYGDARPENFPLVNDYRNPEIATILKNLAYVNRFSSGVRSAKKELQENGNPEPFFDLSLQTAFLVNVYSKI